MAKERLSKAAFVERGYGQVEPNHLSAQRTGQIYAQLPCAKNIEMLENGMFAKYDYEAKEVNLTGDGEWMLVYNEVKTYDARESYRDYKLAKGECPRLLKTSVGDIYTTNKFAEGVDVKTIKVGDTYTVTAGYLTAAESGEMLWKAVKNYTMPDGTPGVKLQRIK